MIMPILSAQHNQIDYCFFEVENPLNVKGNTKIEAEERLGFWRAMNTKRVDFKYIQTGLEDGKESVDCLHLCVKSISKIGKFISSEDLLTFVKNYFVYGFGVSAIYENKEYKIMEAELNAKENVEIKPL